MKCKTLFLSIILCICTLFVITVKADEEMITSVPCGENMTWSFDQDTGTLTFSGTGAISSTEELDYHWGNLYGKIIRVVFGDGVTHVPENAFSSHVSIKDITFLGDMPTFGENCFHYLYCSVFYPYDNPTWQEAIPDNLGSNEIYFQPFGKEATHCGDNATWSYDEDTKTITIGGSGAMYEFYDEMRQPWYDFREEVQYVIIGKDITHIGRNAFSNMTSLEYVRCLGNKPTFSYDHACNIKIPGYYPDGNETWTFGEPMKGSQNGLITWNYFVDTSGPCGANTTWHMDLETGTLTISGTGRMDSYEQWENPWRHYNDVITKVVVKGTVEHIADWSFYRCFEVTEFVIEDGVTSIGRNGLQNTKISSIDLPDSIESIGMICFGSSHNLTEITLPANLKVLEAIFTDCPNLRKVYVNSDLEAVETGLCGLRNCEIYFSGDAPIFNETAFNNADAIVYYPANNPTWTDDVRQLYGASRLTWVPYGDVTPEETTPPTETEQTPTEPTDPTESTVPAEPTEPVETSPIETLAPTQATQPQDTTPSTEPSLLDQLLANPGTCTTATDPIVTPQILEALKDGNSTLILVLENCKWTISGSEITEISQTSINLNVSLNTNNIPDDLISSVCSNCAAMQLHISHSGSFGFTATLTMPVGQNYANQPSDLYHWTSENTLQRVCSTVVNEDGQLDLVFTHASDYLIVISDQQTPAESTNWELYMFSLLSITAIVSIILVITKKKRFKQTQ